MNCQEFETLSCDLARERLMDAAARTGGLAHAATCARCAARLADERALCAGLQAFAAASAQADNAPARLEASLLAAFRARGAGAPPASVAQLNNAPVGARRRRWMPRAAGVAAAAAAAVLVTFGVVAPRWQTNDAPPSQQQQANNQVGKQEAASPVASSSVASPSVAILVEPPVSDENVSTQPSLALTATKETTRPSVRRNGTARGDSGAIRQASNDAPKNEMAANRGAPVAPSNAVSSNVASSNAAVMSDGEVEIATEFMPLVPGGTSASADGSQLVRVELPRSALVSMGLSLNVDGSSERVKADVLLGEDGLARAIRFVR